MKPVNETPLTVSEVLKAFETKQPLIYREAQWGIDECEEVVESEWTIFEILHQTSSKDYPGNPVYFYYAPRTITINNQEILAGETIPPTRQQTYYYPSFIKNEGYSQTTWLDTEVDHNLLKHGMVHLTPEKAKLHAELIIKASGGSI